MSAVLLELHYLPNIQYFTKLVYYPTIYIERCEHYTKGSFRNRCYIGTSHGALQLSIPLLAGKHEQMPLTDVRIDNRQAWQRTHWRSIATAYRSAPFWDYYAESLQPLYEKPHTFLVDFNMDILQWTLRQLRHQPTLLSTNAYEAQPVADVVDFRGKFSPKTYATAHEQDPTFAATPYTQLFSDRQPFLANLSILDAIFCLGTRSISYLKNSYISDVD